jgi:hypothetical protein
MKRHIKTIPDQVCDASDMNTTFENYKTDLGGCHEHARRKFYEIKNSFPSSCGYALREWKIIYRTDKMAKQQNLSPENRLLLHVFGGRCKRLRIFCCCAKLF